MDIAGNSGPMAQASRRTSMQHAMPAAGHMHKQAQGSSAVCADLVSWIVVSEGLLHCGRLQLLATWAAGLTVAMTHQQKVTMPTQAVHALQQPARCSGGTYQQNLAACQMVWAEAIHNRA